MTNSKSDPHTPEAATAMDSPAHWLVVEVDPYDDQEVTASIECAGVTDRCRTWWECDTCRATKWADNDALEDAIEFVYEYGELHGETHQRIDGCFMKPSNQCLGATMDSAWESATDEAHGRMPGRYPCDIVYEGDEYVSVTVLADPVAASSVDKDPDLSVLGDVQ